MYQLFVFLISIALGGAFNCQKDENYCFDERASLVCTNDCECDGLRLCKTILSNKNICMSKKKKKNYYILLRKKNNQLRKKN